MKKYINKFLILSTVAIILSVISYFGFIRQTTLSGFYIESPTFYYFECNAASKPVESTKTILTTGSSGWLSIPSNTDTADLYIRQIETPKWFATDRRITYTICHANNICDPEVATPANSFFSKNGVPTVVIHNLLTTDRVWIRYQYQNLLFQWKDYTNSGAEYYFAYKPFILWKVDMFGGGKTEYTTIEQGCKFPSAVVGGLIDSSSNINLKTQTSSSDSYLDFYKTRNFIGTFVPISPSNVNFVTYNGQTGYCLNRQVFAISTVTTNSDIYRIVDTNFNTRLASSVECCPGEKEPTRICNSKFKWENIDTAECSTYKPCAGADWAISTGTSLIRYNCINGKCVAETKTVECTDNNQCGTGKTCDTKIYQCVKVETGSVGCLSNQTLINGVCVDNEETLQCKWYQTLKVKEEKDYGFLYWRALFNVPIVTEKTECKTSGLIYFGIIVLGLTIIGTTYVIVTKGKFKRRRK